MGYSYAYRHNNIEDCEKQLQRAEKMAEKNGGGILVITEGVFGMSGNQGKLKEIVALKEKYDFRLLIDDAHGFGSMGHTGGGADEDVADHRRVGDDRPSASVGYDSPFRRFSQD